MSGQGPVGALSELIAARRSGECLVQAGQPIRVRRSAARYQRLSAVAWVGCVWARAVQRRDVELAAKRGTRVITAGHHQTVTRDRSRFEPVTYTGRARAHPRAG